MRVIEFVFDSRLIANESESTEASEAPTVDTQPKSLKCEE